MKKPQLVSNQPASSIFNVIKCQQEYSPIIEEEEYTEEIKLPFKKQKKHVRSSSKSLGEVMQYKI